jgi:hypothetical protein
VPYTPTTPTLTLCNDLVAALLAAWTGRGVNDGAERCYFKRIGDADRPETKLLGRKVFIFPNAYDNGPADRGEDEFLHRVSALIVERYEDAAGDPPTEWTDARVDFVYEQIVEGFDYSHDGPPSWNKKLVTLGASVQMCDVEKLATTRLFYSLVEFEFSEIRTA